MPAQPIELLLIIITIAILIKSGDIIIKTIK